MTTTTQPTHAPRYLRIRRAVRVAFYTPMIAFGILTFVTHLTT